MGNTANTLTLARLILRLDRFRIALWLGGLTFFTLIVPVAFQNLYGTQQERDALALTMENPAMTAMVGPGDLENYTMGTMTAHQMILMTAVVAGLMAVLLTSRWTRGEEEEGRVEMIRSLPAGRLAHLMAAILVMILVSVLLAVFTGFGLAVMGEASMTLEGSLLYGTILGGVSLFFGGVTAVAAQLLSNPRGTVGFSIAVLLGSYLFRAVTDISNETLSWVSPLGWVTKAEVYSGNHWGPAVMLVLSAGVLFAAGSWLNSIRDLGRSFVPPRKGRERASRLLQSPLGLTLRLQRTGFIVWAAGVFILGASYGSVLGDMEAFFAENELMAQLLQEEEGLSLTEQFLPMLLVVLSLLITIPPLIAVNKLRGEEKKHRVEHLLGRAVSSTQLLGAYTGTAAVNGFIMLSLTAIGLWAAGNAVMDEGLAFGLIYGAALSYYPAVLVMIGFAVLLIGALPKFTQLVWLYLFYSFVALYLGGLFQFPEWVGMLSPFGHVPQVPVEDVSVLPLTVLAAIAVVLTVLGFIAFRKRDLDFQ